MQRLLQHRSPWLALSDYWLSLVNPFLPGQETERSSFTNVVTKIDRRPSRYLLIERPIFERLIDSLIGKRVTVVPDAGQSQQR